MNLKSILSPIVLFLVAVITTSAESKTQLGNIEFKEPVSGTVFNIDNAVLKDSSRYDYKKAMIYTENTAISIWSVSNPEEKPFTWKKINEFDSNNRFGVMTIQEKLENAEGWLRYFNYNEKNNKQCVYCVALIRGNTYALYVVESAFSAEQLTIPELIKNTDFDKIDKRVANEGKPLSTEFWLVLLAGAVLAGLAKLLFRNNDGVFFTCGIITLLGVAATLYWGLYYSLGTSLLWLFLLLCFWSGVWVAKSWTDFYNFIVKIIENAK